MQHHQHAQDEATAGKQQIEVGPRLQLQDLLHVWGQAAVMAACTCCSLCIVALIVEALQVLSMLEARHDTLQSVSAALLVVTAAAHPRAIQAQH